MQATKTVEEQKLVEEEKDQKAKVFYDKTIGESRDLND